MSQIDGTQRKPATVNKKVLFCVCKCLEVVDSIQTRLLLFCVSTKDLA